MAVDPDIVIRVTSLPLCSTSLRFSSHLGPLFPVPTALENLVQIEFNPTNLPHRLPPQLLHHAQTAYVALVHVSVRVPLVVTQLKYPAVLALYLKELLGQ